MIKEDLLKFVLQEFLQAREEKGQKFLQKHVNEIDKSRHLLISPHIQLEIPQMSQQGNAERVLVENNFCMSVSHGNQSFLQ